MNKLLLCICSLLVCISFSNACGSNTNEIDKYVLSMKLIRITPLESVSVYNHTQRFKLPEGKTETVISIKIDIVIDEHQQWQLKTKDSDFEVSVVIEKKGTAFFGNIECHATAHNYLSVKGRIPIYKNKEFILTSIRSKDSIEVLTWEILGSDLDNRL